MCSVPQDYQPLPASDIPHTLAELSESRQVLGYSPKVKVHEGVHQFVKWFVKYMRKRHGGMKGAENNTIFE